MAALAGLPVGGLFTPQTGAKMLSNVLSTPGEVASSVGLIGIGIVTPMMVEAHLGSIVVVAPRWHWAFSWTAGFCAAIGIAQFVSLLLAWPEARLWLARFSLVACGLLFAVYVPARFYGMSVLTLMLATINILAAASGELRAHERARE